MPVGGLLRQLPLRLGLPLPPPGGTQGPRHDGHADQATGGLTVFFFSKKNSKTSVKVGHLALVTYKNRESALLH